MKNGEAYAHYVAEVVAADAESVTVNMIDRDNKPITEIKFVPKMQKVKVAGKETALQGSQERHEAGPVDPA